MSRRAFRRDDGRLLAVVDGFRAEVLRAAPRFTPRQGWSDADYRAGASKRLEWAELTLERLRRWGVPLRGARVLEIGCGSGLDSARLALEGIELAVGIDRVLPLLARDEAGERARRLAGEVLSRLGLGRDAEQALQSLPLHLAAMDADRLAFPDASFDLVWSRYVLEHLQPLDRALKEIARVLRAGGVIYHAIDPYFWVRGCHRPGLVDIPWAHARLSLTEYERFVSETEGPLRAARRSDYLRRLNRLTASQWRELFEAVPLEVVHWEEDRFPWVEKLLAKYPEAADDTLPGLALDDLTRSRIIVLLRPPAPGRAPALPRG